LCEKLFTHGSVFAEGWNFGPDDRNAQNVEWIINRLCTLWNNEASYEIDQTPQLHEASFLKLDCSKAKKLLGWVPRLSLEKALENIVDWTKAYERKCDMRKVCINQIIDYYNIAESQM
jgi:CDP-glucose 4,6-dehydratase